MPVTRADIRLKSAAAVTATTDKVVRLTIDVVNQMIDVNIGHGNIVKGVFTQVSNSHVRIQGADFTSLAAAVTSGGSLYDEIKTALYNKLIEMGAITGIVT